MYWGLFYILCVNNKYAHAQENKNIHDKFFKSAFSRKEIAADFILNFLPKELVENINLSSLDLSSTSYIDDYEEYFADIVYFVKTENNKDVNICFLFEHKSYKDLYIFIQLLQYMGRHLSSKRSL